ncbi:glycosyltransferase family 9 protein [Campylobacter curvus]|uniref:glycosyltransferase family 9 protein n=1 Tax=Campylobacter curvus TaxID=200 RepID=UPI00146FED6C|nr:glycosyltransferase family 9 protein [Campylobacter curvus]
MKIYELFLKFLLKSKNVKKSEFVDESFKTVCFFSNTALGDTLFNTPVFRAFRQKFPNVKTIALLNPSNADLFKTDPNIDKIILYNGRKIGFLNAMVKLRKLKPDIIFILHSNEPEATPLAALSGAKYIYKMPNLKNKFNILHSNPPESYHWIGQYVVLGRLEHLKFVGIKSNDTKLALFLRDSDFLKVDRLMSRKANVKFIGFQMGASTISKQWFKEKWSDLAKLVLQNKYTFIVLTGSSKEMSMTKEIESELNNERVLNFAGKLNIREAAALISRLDLLVTPDTGPLHVAAALGTPTLALYVAGDPRQSNPNFDTSIHQFIQKDKICDPCISRRCTFQKCMLQINAHEVYAKVRTMIDWKI